MLLNHLQRHSDHHANPTRRYQTLRDFEESPVLPTGYAGMIILALLPPLWRRVMDQRVLDHFDGDITLANIHRVKREKVLARYWDAACGQGRGLTAVTTKREVTTQDVQAAAQDGGRRRVPRL